MSDAGGGGGLLDHAFERTSWGLVLFAADGTIVRLNPAAAALADAVPEELVGRSFSEVVHPDDLVLASSALADVLAVGQVGPLELRIGRADGPHEWITATGTLLPTEPRHVFFVVSRAAHPDSVVHRASVEAHVAQQHLERRSTALADLASLVTSHDDVESLIVGAAGLALRHLAPAAAVIQVDEPGRARLAHIAHRDPEAEALLRKLLAGLEAGWTPDGPLADALGDATERVNFHASVHPAMPELLQEYFERYPAGARCLIPMRTRRGALGALVLIRDAGDPEFSPADVQLAEILASRAAAAIHNAHLDEKRRVAEGETARRAAQQAAIAELGTLALAGSSLEEVADHCRKQIETILEVPYCSVLLDDGHAGGLLVLATSEPVRRHPSEIRRVIDPRALSLMELEGSVVVDDLLTEARFTQDEHSRRIGLRSMAAARIEPRSGHPGVLLVGAPTPAAFSHDDTRFLEAMANVLASTIDAKESFDELRHNAMHDALTGLPNRVLLLDRLVMSLEQAAARGTHVAVLVCDVDRFKVINDGLGHEAGDEVLRSAAQRLRAHVRPGDTVGRFGGDEFVVVCPDVVDLDDVVAIAERLRAAFAEPVRVLGTELVVSASVGIAMGRSASPDAATLLLRDADAAMYRAKARGRGGYEIYDEEMRIRAEARLRTEADLRHALDDDQLVLHYQPVVTADGSRVVGLEALVRWNHPTRGLLVPADFVRIAEESGLLLDLGGWALEEAAQQARRWRELDDVSGPAGWVAVNLAPRQLADPRLLSRIDAAIAGAGVEPHQVRIEITEEALVEDASQTTAALQALRERGIGVSVDDFGTGYSSLAYLRRLPVDLLKLDGAFVAGLDDGEDDVVIASAMIVMAQALGMQVVAEGVETMTQLEVLRALGCDQVQGFLLAPPLPADDALGWLAGWPSTGG